MPREKNITGQRFGNLTALHPTDQRYHGKVVWECQCDCGKVVLLSSNVLLTGRTRSCGCNRTQKKDIAGQRFGKLTALRPTDQRRGSSIVWECQCDCGKSVMSSQNALTAGKVKSCGCSTYHTKDIAGQRFGKLTALRPTDQRRNKSIVWECQCDCGEAVLVPISYLTSGGTQSCGCNSTTKKDISGQRFGRLIALHPIEQRRQGRIIWECQCDCGKTTLLPVCALTSGKTKSCGCNRFKVKDITGQRFGQLTVLRPTDQRINKKILWECRCDCGKIVFLSQNTMATGATKSCGCNRVKWRILDLAGERFGRLTVLRMTGEKRGKNLLWECRCDCGKITHVTTQCLRQGGTQSCGCLLKERLRKGRQLYKKKYCVGGTNTLSLCPKPGIANNSGTVGVSFHARTKKWRADIKFKGKCYTLGEYKDKNEAIAARKKAEEEIHSKFLEQHRQGTLQTDAPAFSDEAIEQTLASRVYAKAEDHSARHQGIKLNRPKTSKYVGVSLKRDSRWAAVIARNRKVYYLGTFNTEELAAEAYDDKARELYGENARLNFPISKATT